MEYRQIQYLGRMISYYVMGNLSANKGLILMGGYINGGVGIWAKQYRHPELQKYKIIILDDFTEKKNVRDAGALNIKDVVAGLHKVIIAEECTAVYLIGFSLGTLFSTLYYNENQDIVKGMVLISPSYKTSVYYSRVLLSTKRLLQLGDSLENVLYLLAPWGFTEEEFSKTLADGKGMVDTFLKYNTVESVLAVLDLLFSSNNSIEIIENDLPIMIFYGTEDIISPINHQEAILSLFRNNTRKEFVNCGHNIFVTQSAVINEMIVAFFNQIQCIEKI